MAWEFRGPRKLGDLVRDAVVDAMELPPGYKIEETSFSGWTTEETVQMWLVLGFSIPYIDDRYFYLVYTNGLGLAIVLTVSALVAIPDLISDLAEAGRIRYSASTLGGVDVDACLAKLDALMRAEHAYRDENLSLASLAESLGVSSQQLSELINTRLGTGFSRYVRERRVEAAKELLGAAPTQSILSVSLDVGFKSQSSFYAAFKEVTGMSPGDYRKANSAAANS